MRVSIELIGISYIIGQNETCRSWT